MSQHISAHLRKAHSDGTVWPPCSVLDSGGLVYATMGRKGQEYAPLLPGGIASPPPRQYHRCEPRPSRDEAMISHTLHSRIRRDRDSPAPALEDGVHNDLQDDYLDVAPAEKPSKTKEYKNLTNWEKVRQILSPSNHNGVADRPPSPVHHTLPISSSTTLW